MKKYFGLIVSIVFAILAIVGGTVYSNKRVEKMVSNSEIKSIKVIDEKKKVENLKQDRGELIYSPMGDSLTAGFSATSEGDRFTNLYAKKIEENLGFKVKMQKGASEYGGLSKEGANSLESIKSQQPDLVTIEYGTNDSDPKNGSSLEEFKQNIEQIINELNSMEKQPKIILVTTWNQGEKANDFDQFIKEIGKEKNIPVADISHIWKNADTMGPEQKETFLGVSDNWHPNDNGMTQISDEIYDVSFEYLIK